MYFAAPDNSVTGTNTRHWTGGFEPILIIIIMLECVRGRERTIVVTVIGDERQSTHS
jgi:hypothetical protein